jgi:hypothetical protein
MFFSTFVGNRTPSSKSLAGIGFVFWVVLAACYWTFELDIISPTETWESIKVISFSYSERFLLHI